MFSNILRNGKSKNNAKSKKWKTPKGVAKEAKPKPKKRGSGEQRLNHLGNLKANVDTEGRGSGEQKLKHPKRREKKKQRESEDKIQKDIKRKETYLFDKSGFRKDFQKPDGVGKNDGSKKKSQQRSLILYLSKEAC